MAEFNEGIITFIYCSLNTFTHSILIRIKRSENEFDMNNGTAKIRHLFNFQKLTQFYSNFFNPNKKIITNCLSGDKLTIAKSVTTI